MWLREHEFTIKIGGLTVINCKNIITFNNEPIFSLYRQEDGYLAIDFEVFGGTGEKIASVCKNNIYGSDKTKFRLIGEEDRLSLLDKKTGATIVDIRKRAGSTPAELSVSVTTSLPDTRLIEADESTLRIGGRTFENVTIQNCDAAIAIEPMKGWSPPSVPRSGNLGMVVLAVVPIVIYMLVWLVLPWVAKG